MNDKYKSILKSIQEWLDDVDPDEFINEMLKIQEQDTGPTCDECFINGHYLNINFSKHYEFEAHKIINKIYKLEAEKESKEACIYIASQLHFLNRDISGTHIVIHLFKNIEYRMLSSWSLIALLRSTYCFKSKIPDWESLYNYTKDYFEESGLDTKKELYGLDL